VEREVPRSDFESVERAAHALAHSASIDETAQLIAGAITQLGFSTVWIGAVDESRAGGELTTVCEVRAGRKGQDQTPGPRELPWQRHAVELAEGERRLLEDAELALPRHVLEQLGRGAHLYRPLFGSRGQPVGAIAMGSYRCGDLVPDEMLGPGPLRALLSMLAVALERTSHLRALDRLEQELAGAQTVLVREPVLRALGELASAVAHELNNLSGIALMALGSVESLSEDVNPLVARADRATRAIADLSRRLQRVARAGGEARHGTADLRQIVEDIAVLLRPLCKENSIRLDLDLVELDESAIVEGDQVLIRQAVMNLILNAREAVMAAPSDRRFIEIRIERQATEISLVVRDGGEGLSSEVQAWMWRPFFSTKPGHAGLGLTTVRSSMRQVGGRIQAGNDPEGGASFRLTFRMSSLSRAVQTPAPVCVCRPLRVLVVDDESEFIAGVRDILGGRGHDVTAATDADEALAKAAGGVFDLVLMDFGLPKKNGLQLMRSMRRRGVMAKMVLMTGWDSEAITLDSQAAAYDGVLQKPFRHGDIDQLVGALFPAG
jgi:signal transduction histidine kinase